MRFPTIAPLLALAATVSAVSITYPATQNATLDFSTSQDLTWDSVSSDPKTVRLELVNQQTFPVFQQVIADSINTADKKYTIQPLSGPAIKSGYQFNFIGTETGEGKNTGIVAQSQQFTVGKVADKASTATSSGAASGSASSTPSATAPPKNAADGLKVGAWGVVVVGAVAAFL